MTDKLTPGQRAQVLRILLNYRNLDIRHLVNLCEEAEAEAARREAEAPMQDVSEPLWRGAVEAGVAGEREGPGSAAAHLKLRDIAPNETVRAVIDKMASEGAVLVSDKPAPAADDFAHSLRSVTTVDCSWDAHARRSPMPDTPDLDALRRTPEPEHASIPAASWADLWEYHTAMSGEGVHGYTWEDKPHRLVYDLTAMCAKHRAEIAALRARLAPTTHADDEVLIDNIRDGLSDDTYNYRGQIRRYADDLAALSQRLAELRGQLADEQSTTEGLRALVERHHARAEKAERALAECREAVAAAEKTFRWYGDLHAAKEQTPDNAAKTKRNYDMADQMARALKTKEPT